MSCLEMTAVGPELQTPDPTKHVLYNLGMVLGVDDFTQEFAYHSERDQWLARDAIGYGTLNGLRVSKGVDAAKGPFVKVCPGTALTPRGQLVRVTAAQCAYLNPWLAANAQTLLDLGVMPPSDELRLYVVLCYRDCPTNTIQIPGEPCQADSVTRIASRLQDDFKLEIRTTAPDQREEDALRRFVEFLRHVHPVDDASGTLSLEQFADLVRQEGPLLLSPIDSPIALSPTGSPDDGIAIPADQLCEYLRLAFKVWVTELRPKYHREPPPGGTGCEPAPGSDQAVEQCLLLSEIVVPVQQIGRPWEVVPPGDIEIDESRRPVLLSVRMLQEWVLCGRCCEGAETLAGDVSGPVKQTRIDQLQGVDLQASGAAEGDVLSIKDGIWQPVSPALDADVTGSLEHNRIDKLQGKPLVGAPTRGDVLTFNPDAGVAGEWQPTQPAPPPPAVLLHDDVVSRADGSSTIKALQGKDVAATDPKEWDVLSFVAQNPADPSLKWRPAKITRLQDTPVSPNAPGPGDVLTVATDVNGQNQWVAAPPTAQPQPVSKIQIVAGGAFFFDAPPPAPATISESFGGFEIIGTNRTAAAQLYILVHFDKFEPKRPYVVSGCNWTLPNQAGGTLELIRVVEGDDSLKNIMDNMRPKRELLPTKNMLLRLSYFNERANQSQFGFTVQITQWEP